MKFWNFIFWNFHERKTKWKFGSHVHALLGEGNTCVCVCVFGGFMSAAYMSSVASCRVSAASMSSPLERVVQIRSWITCLSAYQKTDIKYFLSIFWVLFSCNFLGSSSDTRRVRRALLRHWCCWVSKKNTHYLSKYVLLFKKVKQFQVWPY